MSDKITTTDFDPFAQGSLESAYPLTELQQEIWMSTQMGELATSAYIESISLHLNGLLDTKQLTEALQLLVARHETLRASISLNGIQLCIASEMIIKVPVFKIDSSDKESHLEKIIETEMATPFNLITGPLFRAQILEFLPDDHILIFSAHHIICDGWSMDVILSDLAILYTSLVKNEKPDLKKAPSFSEFADQFSNIKSSPTREHAEAYWLSQFKDMPRSLEIPLDHKRPPIRAFNALFNHSELPKELLEEFKLLTSKMQCSLFSGFIAIWSILLYRISGQNDFVIGIPVAGQPIYGMNELVGHCVHLLPVRFKPQGDMTFSNYVLSVRNLILDAIENHQISLGGLLEKLNVKRDPSRVPLVPICFTHTQKFSTEKVIFGNCTMRYQLNPRCAENFEMHVNVIESQEGLELNCHFNSSLFAKDSIERFSRYFKNLLQEFIRNPDITIDLVDLLSNSEKNMILNDWNKTVDTYPSNLCLHHLFEHQAKKTPGKIAVECNGKTLTYEQLDNKASAFASQLQSAGASSGMLIGIYMERSIDMVVGVLGILKANAAYVPLDPNFPADRIQYMIKDAEIKIIVIDEINLQQLSSNDLLLVSVNKGLLSTDTSKSMHCTAPEINPENVAYVIYTSGSTGKPKGVQVPHRAVVNFLSSMQQKPGITKDDVLAAITTLSFDISVLEIFLPLSVGAKCVIIDKATSLDGKLLIKMIEDCKATVMQATPATWRLLLASDWKGLKSLKILCGGESLSPELATELLSKAGELWNMYGPTETTVWSTCYKVTDARQPIFIGRPISNTQVYILDSHFNPVPIGICGELYIAGDGVTLGYLKQPQLTQKSFLSNPFSNKSGGLLYKTGDLAKFHSSGQIECLGRIDNQVKVRGFRIELGEIETVVASHPAIKQCVATIVGKDDHARLAAYYLLNSDKTTSSNDLRKHLRTTLPEYMIPQYFIKLESFPLTPNGKIDRRALPETLILESHTIKGTHPQTPEELFLEEIWKKVLKVQSVNIDDDFFDIGGTSLLAVQIFSEIFAITNLNLPLASLFTAPTIKELAYIIKQKKPLSNSLTSVDNRTINEHTGPLNAPENRTPLFGASSVVGNLLNRLYKKIGG